MKNLTKLTSLDLSDNFFSERIRPVEFWTIPNQIKVGIWTNICLSIVKTLFLDFGSQVESLAMCPITCMVRVSYPSTNHLCLEPTALTNYRFSHDKRLKKYFRLHIWSKNYPQLRHGDDRAIRFNTCQWAYSTVRKTRTRNRFDNLVYKHLKIMILMTCINCLLSSLFQESLSSPW